MIRTTDIHSLTDFTRNAKSYAKKIRETKNPMAMTVNGTAQLVVLDAETYQQMVDELEHARFIKAMRESEASVKAGKVVSFEEAEARLRGHLDV